MENTGFYSALPRILCNRRRFIRNLSFGFGAGTLFLPYLSALAGNDSFAERDVYSLSGSTQDALQSGRQLGVALVGLGKYSTEELAPALQKTKLCRLTGVVTGSPEKAEKWKKLYKIPDKNVYNYQNFDQIADNADIDIVYVVLPNAMHHEYVIRAARAGKHVICEKPMAMTVAECEEMIAACKKAGKKLSIGYRLHFEPHHREMMRLGQQRVLGEIRKIFTENAQVQSEESPWRLGHGIGSGGPMRDLGVYCIQGAVYTKGDVPVSVTAKYHPKKDPEKFKLIEEGVDFQLQFADGTTADCRVSFNDEYNKLRAEAAKGWFELQPSFPYEGIKGQTSNGPMNLPNVPQQALQMDDFADCILNNKPTRVPGEMGLRDVAIIQAVFEAADTGKKVAVNVSKVLDEVGNKQ
ncbi:MAG: Gfo/Idh/MocA family oxidoreductase [Cytophagales bacterium]|jgi:predicted dehydrogenase|nr:Gfo/Idh/MocA family oxidoreductase [Cytophagales bacterium]